MQERLFVEPVQADEIRVTGHRTIPWMAMAILVPARWWLGGGERASRPQACRPTSC
jgi:hypothetical protein